MKKPIIIDSEWVRPLDAGSSLKICIKCTMASARWMIGKPPNNYLTCARCFLYTSPWGIQHKERIDAFVAEVQEVLGRKIEDEGVVRHDEADRILSSIVAVSGIARVRAQRRLKNESPGS